MKAELTRYWLRWEERDGRIVAVPLCHDNAKIVDTTRTEFDIDDLYVGHCEVTRESLYDVLFGADAEK
jgi:hypothetical protein